MFFFPERYTDVASVGECNALGLNERLTERQMCAGTLAGLTGGNVYFHPRFDPVRDRQRLSSEIRRTLSPSLVYNATVRVRCSNGLRVSGYTGNFYQRSLTDLEFGILDSDKTFSAILKHEGKLDERDSAYMQAAVLYTSASGQRRVRLMNTVTPVTNHIGNVFRFADFDTGMVVLLQDGKSRRPCKKSHEAKATFSRSQPFLKPFRKVYPILAKCSPNDVSEFFFFTVNTALLLHLADR